MKRLLIISALLIALFVPAQASWWSSASSAYVYGDVLVHVGCAPTPPPGTLWTVVVQDTVQGNPLASTITNQLGAYTTPLFSTAYLEEAYVYAIHPKSGFGETYPVEIFPGLGNRVDVVITACWGG